MDAGGYCREVWYYGGFPVLFIDEHCEGQFILTAINLEHLEAINIAQGHFQKTFEQDKKFFDYDVAFLKGPAGSSVPGGMIVIDVPYAGIWFSFKNERLTTSLDIRADTTNASGSRIWEYRNVYPLDLSESELKEKKGQNFRIEIPLVLAQEAVPLGTGKLILHLAVTNTAEGEELKKVLEFRLEP
jgi:hypothetical protein